MIRYVKIDAKSHVFPGSKEGFAFWNTITDRFITVGDSQAWETWNDFERDWLAESGDKHPLERFHALTAPV